MELKIYSPQDSGFIQKIDWNFEELKAEVAAAADSYVVSVYTDDTIKQAKADRAKLNKFVDALKNKRTEIRKKLLEPDEQFGKEVQEVIGIVQKAVDNIDSQVKDYERRQREEKTEKIREFYEDNIHDIRDCLPFERVMKPEYALASTTMKSVKADILNMIQKVDEGLAILNDVDSKFSGDMKEVFLQTYDIGAAMAERNRLEAAEEKRKAYEEERARKMAEREARLKEETERVMAAGNNLPSKEIREKEAVNVRPEPDTAGNHQTGEPVSILDFRVYVTRKQMMDLKSFLKENGIRFEAVPKQERR